MRRPDIRCLAVPFAVQLITRVTLLGLLSRAQRQLAEKEPVPDLLIPAFALLVAPVYLGIIAAWILTGRGPGGTLFAAEQGAARLRPPRV
jgi:hypothetical protein